MRLSLALMVPLMLACSVPVDVQNEKTEGERNARFIQEQLAGLGSSFDRFYVEQQGEQIDAFEDYEIQGEYLVNTYSGTTYYNLNRVIAIQLFEPEWAQGKTAIRIVLD
jgi:hypothetical protein